MPGRPGERIGARPVIVELQPFGRPIPHLQNPGCCFDRLNPPENVTALIASLCIAFPGSRRTEKPTEGVYLLDGSKKVIHPSSPELGQVSVYVSKPIEQRTVEATRRYAGALADSSHLDRVCDLFTQSLDAEHDDFRRFVLGWTALEILVNKIFRDYERVFINVRTVGSRTAAGRGALNLDLRSPNTPVEGQPTPPPLP